MSRISSFDFFEGIFAWDVEKVKNLIAESQREQTDSHKQDYPSLNSIMKNLYNHISVFGGSDDVAEKYWQVLPDEAYEILELLRPFYHISDCKSVAHKHFLYEPIMHGDMRMLKYLHEIHPQEFDCPEINKLFYLGILDFCYMHLPSWQGFTECKNDSNDIETHRFILDLHSPDLMEQLYSQAEHCGIPAPKHLNFLLKYGSSVRSPIKELILSVNTPRLELEVSPAPDYDPDLGRIWKIKDCRIMHKHQDPECLVKSCIENGEYWTLTCECGFPACANVDEPVVAMRFGDIARWRVTASDDDENPDVYYLAVSVKQYLQNFDDLLITAENGIGDVGRTFEDEDTWIPDEYVSFSSTVDGLTKVRRIRSMIRKELQHPKD